MQPKTEKSITRSDDVAEYLKIRQHVLNVLIQNQREPMKLASTRELAKLFSVSRPTVQKALRDLAEEGFLVIRHGVGVFSVPGKFNLNDRERRIGLLIGDGKFIFYDSYFWQQYTALGTMIGRHGYVQPIALVQNRHRPADELRPLGLSALVWLYPMGQTAESLAELAGALPFPLVVVNGPDYPGASVSWDYREEGLQVGRRLLAEGRVHPMVLRTTLSLEPQMAGFRQAYAAGGQPFNDNMILGSRHTLADDLRRLIDFRVPFDAVYFCTYSNTEAIQFLSERGVDFSDRCRLVTNRKDWFGTFPGGLLVEYPVERLVEPVEELLAERLGGRNPAHGTRMVPVVVRETGPL